MFKEVPMGIKVIAIINTIINLLLLIFLCSILLSFVPFGYFQFILLGLFIVCINFVLGFGIILLRNWARRGFILMQIVSLALSIYPFLVILQFGLGNPSQFGDNREQWASLFTTKFFGQLVSFIIGMSFPVLPMLFSIFCIFYLLRFSIKNQFK
jgi:hypothetical protein